MSARSLCTANLVFERRIRGHLPVTRTAINDSGELMVVVPDDHQPRLYHIVRLADGECREAGSFSVEKLQYIDFSERADTFIAITDDDVYVFRDDTKRRCFADRRENYTAVSLSSSGEHFAIGSTDMILSSYSVTLAKTAGGQVWVKDLPFSATSMRITDDAARVLVGSEDGPAVMLDDERSVLWQLEGTDPITALEISSSGEMAVLGTRGGSVYAIGEAGNMLWDAARGGRIVRCAINRAGDRIVVAHDAPDGAGVIGVFHDDGTPILEYTAPARITSVACSPSGGFLAFSCTDGTVRILEIFSAPGRSCTEHKATALRAEGIAAAEQGEHRAAVEKLTEYLRLCAYDADACAVLAKARASLVEQHLSEAERLLADGDVDGTIDELRSANEFPPGNLEDAQHVYNRRERLISDSLDRIEQMAQEGRLGEAISLAQGIIDLDFTNCRAREVLGTLESKMVSGYLAEADAALDEGRPADAVKILEQAAAISPSQEIRDKLCQARAAQALHQGKALYEDKKFSQAVFQFRKVLSIDPDNAEAQRYIEYAEGLRQDDSLFDRFSKLE